MANHQTNLIYHIRDCIDLAASLGLTLSVGSDFSQFIRFSDNQPLRHPVNPAFNPQHCDLGPANAFWLIGKSRDRELVLTQAIKLLPLGEKSLGRYMADDAWEFRTHGYNLDAERTEVCLTPDAARLSGRITYHGELWLKGGKDGIRGGCLATIVTRLMIMLALVRWNPDGMIGLQSPTTSCRGLAVREGYLRTEQRSIVWYQKGSNIPMEDWLVWMTREEAMFNLRLPPRYFFELFETVRKPEYELAKTA